MYLGVVVYDILVVESREPVPGKPLRTVSDDMGVEGLRRASRYLSVYMQALQAMITIPFPWKVQVPLKRILSAVCELTSVAPDSVVGGWETEIWLYVT